MGETANQIANHIEQTRDHLGSSIHELERKVTSVTDWKQHFDKAPLTMLGLAFGGGVLLATLGSGKKRHSFSETPSPGGAMQNQKQEALQVWEDIKSALVGVAATQVKGFIGQHVPGFTEQLSSKK